MTCIELCLYWGPPPAYALYHTARIERDLVSIAAVEVASICIEKERKKVSLSEINVDWLFSITGLNQPIIR